MAVSAELGERLERFVAKLVKSGRYNSKSEVLREGVRLVQERERDFATLESKLKKGIADIDAGRVRPIEDVAARLEAKYTAMIEAQRNESPNFIRGRKRS